MADNNKMDPSLLQASDQIFWEEFNQMEHPGDRYIVIDSKNNTVVTQNARLVREVKKVRV